MLARQSSTRLHTNEMPKMRNRDAHQLNYYSSQTLEKISRMPQMQLQNGAKIMEKYRVELELNFKPKVDSNNDRITKSHINAIGRTQVWEAIELALHKANLTADVYLVRKVNS
jgi:hypothetical protein